MILASPQPLPPAAGVNSSPALPSDVVRASHSGGWLISVWVPVVLALALVALVAVLVTRYVLRRRAQTRPPWIWTRRSLAAMSTFSMLLLAVGAGVNAYAGYFPTLTSAERFLRGDETGTGGEDHVLAVGDHGNVVVDAGFSGSAVPEQQQVRQVKANPPVPAGATTAPGARWEVQSLHLQDPALDISSRTVVFAVPPGYAAGAAAGHRYPVVYLLSGYPGRPSDWLVAGHAREVVDALVADRLLPQVILVAPDVNGGFYNDSETLDQVHGPQVQTWLTRDVVGFVDGHLSTLPERNERMLVGMSSGGYAALNVGLLHQNEFGLIGAMEPYGDPGNVTARLLGGDVALLHAESPSWYLPTEAFHRKIVTFMDIGSGAAKQDVARVQGLAALMARRGQQTELRVEEGDGHTWTEALQGLPYALAFGGRHFGDPALLADYPARDFPTTHGSATLRELSQDAETARARTLAKLGLNIDGKPLHPGSGPSGTPAARPAISGYPVPAEPTYALPPEPGATPTARSTAGATPSARATASTSPGPGRSRAAASPTPGSGVRRSPSAEPGSAPPAGAGASTGTPRRQSAASASASGSATPSVPRS